MISDMLFFVCLKSKNVIAKTKDKMMSHKQEDFLRQFYEDYQTLLFKGDWKEFCKAKNTDEEMLKTLLFKGDLSKEEFQSIVSCIVTTYSFEPPALFYPGLFKKCPQLIERCNWHMLNNWEWLILLEEYPQFVDKCDTLDEFDGEDWSCLLCEQPQFADKCDKWDKIDSEDWFELLCSQPQFADRCNKWDEFDGSDWWNLLRHQPQFADKFDKWNEFSTGIWSQLLREQPQFADKCNKWDEFDEDEKEALLDAQPQLAKYFNDKSCK